MPFHTYSGWPVVERTACRNFTVPGTDVVLPLHPAIGPLMVWVAVAVHKRVAPLSQAKGCWGWAGRLTRGSATRWSNHAGGVAADFNATIWPRGLHRMTDAQVAEVRQILGEVNAAAGKHVLDWGGDYKVSPVDQMHVEAAYGSTEDDFTRALKVLTTPRVTVYYTGKPGTRTVRPGSRGDDVKMLKRWFGLSSKTGLFGPGLALEVRRWKKDHKLTVDTIVGPKAWDLILGGKK